MLREGRKSPFQITLYSEAVIPLIANYSLKVSWQDCPAGKPIGLEILSNSSFIDTYGWLRVVGEIQNVGTETAWYVKVIATFYGEKGNVVYTEYAWATLLDPEEIEPFEIEVYDEDRIALISSYSLTAESEEYAVVPEFLSFLILPLFMISTLLAVIVFRLLNTIPKKD